MPRQSRIDAPEALHHIIARGIDRKVIFRDDRDRDDFLTRLGTNLEESQTPCYAWALLPNHFHLLLRTGAMPISTLMRRVLTGYAVAYNLRHHRHGHLFQNRFKSILCQEEPYLLELVRYIHLNPLRAGIVEDLKSLERYPYSGHRALLQKDESKWQDLQYVLSLFAKAVSTARRGYLKFIAEGIPCVRRPDLIGGGLIRSVGGWSTVRALKKMGAYQKGDERILGNGEFVEKALSQAHENLEHKHHLKAKGFNLKHIANRVAELMGLQPAEVLSPGKYHRITEARSILCFWAVRDLGNSLASLAMRLEMSPAGVGYAVQRGEAIAQENGYELIP